MLADRKPTLLFLCPLPNICPGVSLLARLADRTPALVFPVPLLVAEFGGLPLCGSLPVDIEGDGEEVDECMPFVCIPGGIGRLTLAGSDWTDVAEGAILSALQQRTKAYRLSMSVASRTVLATLLRYRRLQVPLSI